MENMENKGGFEPFLISFLEGAVFSFKRLFRVFPQQQWPSRVFLRPLNRWKHKRIAWFSISDVSYLGVKTHTFKTH